MDRLRDVEQPRRRPGGKQPAPGTSDPKDALFDLQARVGNRAVADLLRNGSGAPGVAIQRHALEDALPDASELLAEIATLPGPGSDSGAGANATAGEDGGAPSPDRTPAEATAQKTEATKAGADFVKAGDRALSLAGAEKVLQGAFGGLKKIVPGSVQVLADDDAIWAKYDEVCIADHIKNPTSGVLWKSGDSKIDSPNGLRGFAWKSVVYVNSSAVVATTVPHEILHNNAAADFRGTVGEVFNEGKTNNLALEAILAAGIPKPASMSYVTEMALTDKLEALITKDVLTNAYFAGAGGLAAAYDAKKGAGRWATLAANSVAHDNAKTEAELDKEAAVKVGVLSTPGAGSSDLLGGDDSVGVA